MNSRHPEQEHLCKGSFMCDDACTSAQRAQQLLLPLHRDHHLRQEPEHGKTGSDPPRSTERRWNCSGTSAVNGDLAQRSPTWVKEPQFVFELFGSEHFHNRGDGSAASHRFARTRSSGIMCAAEPPAGGSVVRPMTVQHSREHGRTDG